MEDAMRDLMGPPAQAPAGEQTTNHNWQGGNEHVLMDASYYLDDLLRNMQGNAVDGDTPGGIRGASQLQNQVSPVNLPAYGNPLQTLPIRRPSPFHIGSLQPQQQHRIAQPVPQRLVAQSEHDCSGSGEESNDNDMSSERSEQTNSQSLITHRSVRSDPGVLMHGQGPRSNKRGRSSLGKEGTGLEEQSYLKQGSLSQQRLRSSPRISWKDGRGGSKERSRYEPGGQQRRQEDSDEEEKKGKKGAGGGNREAVRKYRAKKKAQAREMELQLERLRTENAVLTKRASRQQELEREVLELRNLVLSLYQRLGEKPPARVQQAVVDAGHTADSDKPSTDADRDSKLPVSGLEERPASPNLLPTGNSSTLANVVLADRGTAPSPSLPTLAQAQLPDFPGSDWLAAMSAMEACQSTLTALPPAQAPMGFSYQNAALLPNKSPLHSTIQEGLAFHAPTEHQDFGSRFNSSD